MVLCVGLSKLHRRIVLLIHTILAALQTPEGSIRLECRSSMGHSHVDATCWPGVQLGPLISELHFLYASHNIADRFLEHLKSKSSKREQGGIAILRRQKLKSKYLPGVMLRRVMLVDGHRVILGSGRENKILVLT